MTNFEEGLGRVMYVVGALQNERPFPAPLYKFVALHARSTVRLVPDYASSMLACSSQEIERMRLSSCSAELRPAAMSHFVDAQASATRTGTGGWLPVLDHEGVPDPYSSPWYSLEITSQSWIFEKGGRPSLVISTLEASAFVVAL